MGGHRGGILEVQKKPRLVFPPLPRVLKSKKATEIHFFRYPFLNITDSECFSASLNTFLHRNNSIRNNPEQGKRKRIRNSALKKWVQLVQHSNSSAIKHPKYREIEKKDNFHLS